MRRIIIPAMFTAAALVSAASCNEVEDRPIGPDPERTVITAVAEAVNDVTRAHNQYIFDVLWDKGDRIYVTDGTKGNTFTVSDESAGTKKGKFTEDTPSYGIKGEIEAFYPASLKADEGYVWPAVQTNNQAAPMFARQTISGTGDETVSFSCLGAMLQIVFNTTVPNIVLKSIELEDGAKPLSGDFTVDTEGKAVITAEETAAITLDLGEGKILGKGANYFYIAIPAGNYEDLTLTFKDADNGCFLMKGGKLDIKRNTVGRLTLTGSKYHFDILPGVFTVGDGPDGLEGTEDDVKVRFSPGNLRYDVEKGIWSFFQNQYDCGPATYTDGHDKEISLFTWGYGNWSTIPDTEEYLYGIGEGKAFNRAQDWGTRMGDGNTWRTLTAEEVQYLFKDFSIIGRAIVHGINGHILVPPTFIDPQTNRGSGAFVPFTKVETDSGFEDNIYSLESDWNAMESAGAVFIPAAGYRSKNGIVDYGTIGGFWTSSSNYLENPARAQRFHLNNSKSTAHTILAFSYCGYPVRLVTEAE